MQNEQISTCVLFNLATSSSDTESTTGNRFSAAPLRWEAATPAGRVRFSFVQPSPNRAPDDRIVFRFSVEPANSRAKKDKYFEQIYLTIPLYQFSDNLFLSSKAAHLTRHGLLHLAHHLKIGAVPGGAGSPDARRIAGIIESLAHTPWIFEMDDDSRSYAPLPTARDKKESAKFITANFALEGLTLEASDLERVASIIGHNEQESIHESSAVIAALVEKFTQAND